MKRPQHFTLHRQSTSKNQQCYLLNFIFLWFSSSAIIWFKVYFCYIIPTYPHNNEGIGVLFYFTIHWFHFNKHNWQPKTVCDYLLLSASVCEYFLGNCSPVTAHPASPWSSFHSQRHITSCVEGQTWNLILTCVCVCVQTLKQYFCLPVSPRCFLRRQENNKFYWFCFDSQDLFFLNNQ